MRAPVAIGTLILGATIAAGGQTLDQRLTGQLKRLFPDASAFSPKEGAPPHFKAFASDPQTGARTIVGYAFWTTDLIPEQLGYHGHIHMLIGMDTRGRLTGVIMDRNTEPYGDISIEKPEFAALFPGKSIRDKFVAGEDVPIMSRATITVRAAAREIRDASRMVAKAVLSPEAVGR